LLVDQSSSIFSPNQGEIVVNSIFDISIRSGDICDRSLKLSEIEPSCMPTKFQERMIPNFRPCLSAQGRSTWTSLVKLFYCFQSYSP